MDAIQLLRHLIDPVEILDHDQQGLAMARAQRDLAEGLRDADLDRVRREEIEPLDAVLVAQEIEHVGLDFAGSMPTRPSVCRIFSRAPAASSASVMWQSPRIRSLTGR